MNEVGSIERGRSGKYQTRDMFIFHTKQTTWENSSFTLLLKFDTSSDMSFSDKFVYHSFWFQLWTNQPLVAVVTFNGLHQLDRRAVNVI